MAVGRPLEQAVHDCSMSRRASSKKELECRVGYVFADQTLLDRALTHISALPGARSRSGSYQRLEFLGDHVLGLAVSDMLFRAFPEADEGELSGAWRRWCGRRAAPRSGELWSSGPP